MDHDKTQECYEFLDLSDVDDSERNHLTTALYSSDHNQQASWVHDNHNTAVAQNIPAVQNPWHETPFGLKSEQIADVTSATSSVVRNLVMPRMLTPLAALPIYAIVKPSALAPIAAVPSICASTTQVLSGSVTSVSSSDIDYIKDNQSQSALMSPQTTNPITQQGANQQQQNMNNQQQQQHQQQTQHNQAVYASQQYIGQVGTQIGGAMYQMVPHVMPNVYVSNVTANGNVHGYMTQAIPQYMTNTTPTFVHLTEANQGGQLHEHQQQATNSNTNISTNIRGSSRRGRGRSNGGHRREYTPRPPPQQQQQQEMMQSMMESQQVLGSSGFTQYYPINPYWMGHPSAQHASGSAVYLSAGQIPMYATAAGHQMYAYHPQMMYQTMIPHDYSVVVDEKGEEHGQEHMANGTVMQPMWHPHMALEYQETQMEMPPPNQEEMLQLEMLEDVNQNVMQIPMQMTQHQIQQQIPLHSPHVLNPNVATFTSLKAQQQQQQQQQQYQNEYMVQSNMMMAPQQQQQQQQSINVNQQMNKIHQAQQQPQHHQQQAPPPPQQTTPPAAVLPQVLMPSDPITVSVNNPKNTENKNLNVNCNKDLTQVPSTIVTNMNIKVPVATTVTNNNKNNNSNFINSHNINNNNNNINNNVNRISNNNNSVNTKINQNVPNPSSHSTDVVVSASGNSTSFVNSNIIDDTVSKLVKTTNDKLMIKNERGNKPPAWNNNHNNSNIYNNSYNNSNKNVNISHNNSNISSMAKKVSNPSAQNIVTSSIASNKDNKMQPSLPLIANYGQSVQKTVAATPIVVNQIQSAITAAPSGNNTTMRHKLSPPPFANNPAVVKSNNSPFVPKSNQMNSISPIMNNSNNNSNSSCSSSNNSASNYTIEPLRNVPQMVSNKKTEITQKMVTSPQPQSTSSTIMNSPPPAVAIMLQSQSQPILTQVAVEPSGLQNIEQQPPQTIKPIIAMQISNKEAGPITAQVSAPIITNNISAEHKEKLATPVQSNTVMMTPPAAVNSSVDQSLSMTSTKDKEATVTTPQLAQISTPTPAAAPSTKSWASLFVGGKSSSVAQSSMIDQSAKKPTAKVFPFEGTVNYNPIPTPGGISYSAASSQGLPAGVNNDDFKKSSPDQPYHTHHHQHSSDHTNSSRVHDGWSSRLGVFFHKYQIDNNSACITPRGLTNRSNYCYINAILQALVSCPPFYNLLRSIPTQPSGLRTKSTTPILDAMTDLAAEFSMMSAPPPIRITRREKGQKREDLLPDVNPDAPFEPTVIHKMLNGIRSDVFQVEGRQEDAEEFLGCVLNKMNDEMLEVMKMVDNKNKVANGTIEQNIEEPNDEGSDWQVICGSRNKGSITRTTDFGRTPVSDIFRGQLRSRVQREGDASTDVVQPFFTLQLYIEKAASVKEALELLVVKDQLEGVTCSKTKQEVAAWQQVTIEELPIILILHLKCFDYKMDGCTKILKTVEFPIELKIDSKFMSSKNKYTQKQKQYKLFAVVYHDGKEAVKGHYLTDVFHAGYNSWIRYDDSIVKPVTEHHVLHPRSPRIPYLLYYRRCDTIGGGGGGISGGGVASGQQQQQQQQQLK